MARSLFEPELLRKNIDEKQRQLEEIQEDLNKLPLEDPLRARWLERMLHLQKGIPELEAKLAERTRAQPRDSAEHYSPLDSGAAKPNTGKKPSRSSPAHASKRRAKVVARVLEELLVLKEEPNFALEEDFKALKAMHKYHKLYVLEAATLPRIKDLLLTVKDTRNKKPVGLACEIVAKIEHVSLDTVRRDWKEHKPNKYRRP